MIQRQRLLFVLLLAILGFRFFFLNERPPHHDEAVNGWFVDGMFKQGFYRYDPSNYHGPLYFYLLAFFEVLFGRSIEVLRLPPILFGSVLSMIPFLYQRYIGNRAAWIAAFFFAVSPAMVFYSRYSIHETGFALAGALTVWQWLQIREQGWNFKKSFALGSGLAFLATMKENFILLVVTVFIAEGLLKLLPMILKSKSFVAEALPKFNEVAAQSAGFFNHAFWNKSRSKKLGVSFCLAIMIIFVALVFAAFGRDPDGIINFFKAFYFWSETGSKGNGHSKPFIYFYELLFRFEWMAIVGVGTSLLMIFKVNEGVRLLSLIGFGLALGYSIVSYKTPWCLLCFYWALVMVAAYWIARLSEIKNKRIAARLALPLTGILLAYSAQQAYSVAYVNVDGEHPYIYGQTYKDLMPPVNEILDRVKVNPELKTKLRIQVYSAFTWPLPYLLGEITQTGYYNESNLPAVLDADYIILDETFDAQYSPRIKGLAEGLYSKSTVRARQWASRLVFYRKR
jgi:uncharacterized protein (TIGR03663 family)